MIKFCVWFCLMIFAWQQLSAQDGALQQTTERYAADYMSVASRNAALFSGVRQQPVAVPLLNHQYYMDQDYTTGKLSYCGVVYPGVSVRWDLYRDEFVILSPDNYNIALKSENIDFAEIYGHHIFYLQPDGLPGCPSAGNYIHLYSSDEYLLLERLTNIMYRAENVQNNRYQYYFDLSTSFFLRKEGRYYKITNRRTLLKTLKTHRRELRKFINAHDLRYKSDAEKMVLEVVKEHEKLNRS